MLPRAQLGPVIIGLHIAQVVIEKDIDWNDQNDFIKVHHLEALAQAEVICFSVMVFAGWIKLFDYLSVFPNMYRFIVMIEMVRSLFCLTAVAVALLTESTCYPRRWLRNWPSSALCSLS